PEPVVDDHQRVNDGVQDIFEVQHLQQPHSGPDHQVYDCTVGFSFLRPEAHRKNEKMELRDT
ncbi:MAG: hypothetical protein M1550_05480, partial [Deltaproteobacteria bacterium]|nr:hypothetical protein [Deltaproteobacteria bacterium]